MSRYILALDQGTTSSRALIFDAETRVKGVGQYEFAQHFPASGWVEHEAEDLWTTTLQAARDALAAAGVEARDIAAVGITNQRETVVVWDKASGEAIHRAIVWQDRRTAEVCQSLRDAGHEADTAARTGLLLDPYFSATKVAWILVKDCSADFGMTETKLFGVALPIRGVAGDQQSAMIGQACFQPGAMKSTYGTGCFALLNTGDQPVFSRNRLLTTIAYQLNGKRTYALEGSIFVAGAAVQWLRDGLGVLSAANQSGPLAAMADPEQDVIMVPAFVGLGAPHWSPNARGALFGLTRATGPKELARAALDSVCFQTVDLIDAMTSDWKGAGETVLRVDGGMSASDWTMQRLADLVNAPVDRPEVTETTALGAAYLAGLAVGLYPEPSQFADRWRLDRRFTPLVGADVRAARITRWRKAVKATLSFADEV